ncbi:hypothetical protein PDJAM_G00085110 [Pangasius djambal]|uniref:Uncharacterized protein n=1 Tax=Pangasius djambal TaxID=1691987 RepID=A0ACC5Z3M5_9TELE|nr:hypothetical protein [Pangasius djambal]
MSLADQSLQFFPVSARVSVLRARGLRIKGKDGTNDAYTALQAGRETFRTPVAEKRTEPVWGGDDAAFIFTLPAESARAEQDGVPLQVRVLHRVPLGADKLLGLTVINVHELRQNSARENPQWFKLLNKAGKADKERGEILLDIQFLKSSMSVSMIDLSDKSHSRIGKFKDKLRGKKKDGLSDSASAILPSVSQVLTDSEGEMDGETEGESPKKKKNKLKSLFVPKSNMKRNSMSQSMSSLGTLPDKNSSISSSTSSGLNVESSEGKKKKKFTFLTHKRNGSTDSKASNHSDFTLGSANQNPPSQIDICINGSHVYREATQTRISNVKPSVSVSATVSQPSMANTNPFLDDDLDGSISENVISVEETTAKKGRAPLPPHKKPQLTGSDVSSRGVPKQHCHLKDISKRPAPQPPGTMTREVTVKEKMDQAGLCQGARKTPERHHASKVSSVSQEDTQVDTNPFTCDGPVAVKHKRPAPKPGSGISVSEDKPRNYGKNLTEGTVHLEEKASASNSKGNPPNWKLLSAQNDITAEDVISDLTDDLSQREKHLEDIVEPDSAKPNVPSCVNQDLCPEPLISNTDGLPSMERSKKKSQAPLPPSKPKRTGDPSTPHQQLSLPNKTNLEQAQESHSNKKYQDNALASSVEILAISTPSSFTVSSSTFIPLAEKSQVMKPCATESLETDSGSGSSTLPCAKVVPSDAGEVREQVAPTSVIRQHAVKPLSAAENLPETHESRVTDNTQPKTKAASAVMKGPYSQLTQTELISLALRQQEQISQRDARIQELEQYIDNLLVRVMEEKPSILMTMDTKNKSM